MVKKFLQSFIFGALAIVGAFVVQVFIITILSVLNSDYSINSLFYIRNTLVTIIVIAIIEEVFRVFLLKRLLEIVSGKNILFTGFSFGLGFSFVELMAISQNISLNASILSLISVFLLHVILSIIVLYMIDKKCKTSQIIISLILVIFMHVIYNFAVNIF